jgi:tetratricopeptide (TPR) repeat protein
MMIIRITLVICLLSFGFIFQAHALNLDKLKVYFLEGDYGSAIKEGEKAIATAGQAKGLDELYYILGLSYLKDGNYLRASDIFEIIIREFKDSRFKEEAQIGLGDAYFLRQDFNKAQDQYNALLNKNPRTLLKAQLYYRLSETAFKKGDAQLGKTYLDKLNSEFPSNLETKSANELCLLPSASEDAYYNVQVGAFSSATNAKNLLSKLTQKGYPAYIQEQKLKGAKSYRVKVGKSKNRDEIVSLGNKLSLEGYPARICP